MHKKLFESLTLKSLVASAISLFLFLSVSAQTPETDAVSKDSAKKKTNLTVGALYSSNAGYFGQVAEEKLPYVALAASVRFPSGFYISGLAYKLLRDSQFVSATGLGAGYSFHLARKISADLSYAHSFFPSRSPFLQASSPNIASATVLAEYFVTTGLSFDYTFGQQNDYFLTFKLARAFNIPASQNKAVFSITPETNFIAGTQRFYEDYVVQRLKLKKGKGNPNPPGGTQILTQEVNRFGMLSYNFKLPVSYSRASYMVEASAQVSVLGPNAVTGTGNANTFLNLGVYYQF